jgi:hypothetical protein
MEERGKRKEERGKRKEERGKRKEERGMEERGKRKEEREGYSLEKILRARHQQEICRRKISGESQRPWDFPLFHLC